MGVGKRSKNSARAVQITRPPERRAHHETGFDVTRICLKNGPRHNQDPGGVIAQKTPSLAQDDG
jgi:hypothetical protein